MSDSYTDSYGNAVRAGDLIVLATASGGLYVSKIPEWARCLVTTVDTV